MEIHNLFSSLDLKSQMYSKGLKLLKANLITTFRVANKM